MQLKNKQGNKQNQNAHTYKHPIATNKKPKTIHTHDNRPTHQQLKGSHSSLNCPGLKQAMK